MKRLTTLVMVLAVLVAVVGCGGGSGHTESAMDKAKAAFVRATSPGSECHGAVLTKPACFQLLRNVCQSAVGSDPKEAQYRAESCESVKSGEAVIMAERSKEKEAATSTGTTAASEHTPEEEAAHNKSLETQQREEGERAAAQKAVEEDETRGGEHSIRRVEEKVCYESGKSSEECKGPLRETPQEERSEAENRARQRQGEVEGGERPLPTPGCQTGGCVE